MNTNRKSRSSVGGLDAAAATGPNAKKRKSELCAESSPTSCEVFNSNAGSPIGDTSDSSLQGLKLVYAGSPEELLYEVKRNKRLKPKKLVKVARNSFKIHESVELGVVLACEDVELGEEEFQKQSLHDLVCANKLPAEKDVSIVVRKKTDGNMPESIASLSAKITNLTAELTTQKSEMVDLKKSQKKTNRKLERLEATVHAPILLRNLMDRCLQLYCNNPLEPFTRWQINQLYASPSVSINAAEKAKMEKFRENTNTMVHAPFHVLDVDKLKNAAALLPEPELNSAFGKLLSYFESKINTLSAAEKQTFGLPP